MGLEGCLGEHQERAAGDLRPGVFQSEVTLGWCSCPLAHPWWRRGEVAAQVLLGEQACSPPHIAAWNHPRASHPRPCSPSSRLPSSPPGSANSHKQPLLAGKKRVAPQPLNCRAGRPQGSWLARCPQLRDARPGTGKSPGGREWTGWGHCPEPGAVIGELQRVSWQYAGDAGAPL